MFSVHRGPSLTKMVFQIVTRVVNYTQNVKFHAFSTKRGRWDVRACIVISSLVPQPPIVAPAVRKSSENTKKTKCQLWGPECYIQGSILEGETLLTVCYFYGCSCLRSSIELPMERALLQWQFLYGACQWVSLWSLKLSGYCATAWWHAACCVWAGGFCFSIVILTVLKWSLLASGCEFFLLGIACFQALFVSCE